ncbi:hypothetical protein ACX80D_12165 [Arthrobacter sp. Sr24]
MKEPVIRGVGNASTLEGRAWKNSDGGASVIVMVGFCAATVGIVDPLSVHAGPSSRLSVVNLDGGSLSRSGSVWTAGPDLLRHVVISGVP